jgi:hypothetical protein
MWPRVGDVAQVASASISHPFLQDSQCDSLVDAALICTDDLSGGLRLGRVLYLR